MSKAELSDNGSLTPPLADIERQWQQFAVTDDTITIDTESSPKRQKTEEFYGESKANCLRLHRFPCLIAVSSILPDDISTSARYFFIT